MKIDKTTFPAPNTGFHKKKTTKKQIIIGFSLREDNNHIQRFYNKSFDDEKSWSTFTIDKKGIVYEHFNPKYYSEYLKSKPKVNPKVISITLSNMGFLTQKENGDFVNRLNEICPSSQVVQKKIGDLEYWDSFPAEQIDSLVNLCIYLCKEYNIKQNAIDFVFYNKTTDAFNGIVFRSNYSSENIETNESFDIDNFVEQINGNYEAETDE
ncbi:MAG: N-acetylmuramoyl-L-alanine amidase [bacterium]